ncbi:SDR family oxidoreductase [Catalinimonas niigatensis]|uniref:SDR family oxidoreductase n=1 Tax=Catalinimonas niigatensis TaxID=1397264 RepID=UPI0026663D87|nr:SDR family oxidoreductase [Catalinimonas niigatensis]WPP50053.1 SDR family oxidoreductase [Catalinimonas niigatensis]
MNTKLFEIKGKVIVIPGGGGALGGAMAKVLLEQGAKIAILSLHEESANKRVEELKTLGEEVIGFACDVTSKESLEAVNRKILEKWGRIDVLINAAGGNMPGATVSPEQTVFDVSVDALKKVLDLNLMGSVLPTLVFGKAMAEQKSGSIINISSMAATHSITRVLGYSIAKAGIDMFTKWMAMEMAMKFGDGIRVNAIAPGFFIGKQNLRLLTNEDGSLTQRGETIIKNTPMQRFGDAEELNGAVLYLCSEASKFVTGTILPVDGGFSSFSGV